MIRQPQKLVPGPGSVRRNVALLMQPIQSASRKKAIRTIANKQNVDLKEAQFRQAIAIAKGVARKS